MCLAKKKKVALPLSDSLTWLRNLTKDRKDRRVGKKLLKKKKKKILRIMI
jgi:hypothetical protein